MNTVAQAMMLFALWTVTKKKTRTLRPGLESFAAKRSI